MSSVNKGLCRDTGDMLGWGKARGRADTSALWTPSSWKASLHHDLLKEQLVLYTKPLSIGMWSHWSTGWQISDPWAHSSAPPGLHSPKHTTLRPAWLPLELAPKACQSSDPQVFTISTPTGPESLRSAQACVISAPLGCAPNAYQAGDP
jgi:hypothetical protein